MSQPINLNKARKARARLAAKAQADENAVKFGRSKAEKILDATQNAQAKAKLDQLKFEEE